MINLSQITRFCFYLFFFFLPFQINTTIWADVNFLSFLNSYSSFSLYLSDICFLLSLFFLTLSFLNKEKIKLKIEKIFLVLLGVFLFFAIFSLHQSINFTNSFLQSFHLLEFIIMALLIGGKFIDLQKLLYVILISLSLVSIIAVLQFIFQHSLNLEFLGEPLISTEMKGVAKFQIMDFKLLRSYGTFPHPNLLAGYLAFGLIFAISLLKSSFIKFSKYRRIVFVGLFLIFLALILTFSRSAFFALFCVILFYFFNNKKSFNKTLLIFSLLIFLALLGRIFFWDATSFSERWNLLLISKTMFLQNIFGVGIGNFTLAMQEYFPLKLWPWEFQPVHNIFLLILNEIGILGFSSFLTLCGYIIWRNWKIKNFLIIFLGTLVFVIGFFDHYFWSLYQGQALFWLFIGLGFYSR